MTDREQHSASDKRHRLDPQTIERGRAHIAEIRSQLASGASRSHPKARQSAHDRDAAADTRSNDVGEGPDRWSVDQMSAEMATGAERELLIQRNTQLERENERLRAALGAVLEAAGSGLKPDAVIAAADVHDDAERAQQLD